MEFLLLGLLLLAILLLLMLFYKKSSAPLSPLEDLLNNKLQKEFLLNREELSKNSKENRNELIQSLERLNETLTKKAKMTVRSCVLP